MVSKKVSPIFITESSSETLTETLLTAEERYRLLVEGAKDYAMFLLDAEGLVTSWNSGAERILGWTESDMLGQLGERIFTPEDRAAGVPAQEFATAAAQGKAIDLRWHMKADGSRFFADGILECLHGEDGQGRGFAKILRDATASRIAEDERKQAQEELAASHQRMVNVLESITDAFFTVDTEWRFTYINPQCERLLARPAGDLRGKSVWDEFPAAVGTEFDRQYRRAMADQIPVAFEEYYPVPLDQWFEVRAYPSREGLSVFFHDITEQAEHGRRERFLSDLGDRARRMTDPDEVIADAVRSVGKFLSVSRCIFADIDIEADTCTIRPDYCADDTVASIVGVVPISAFGSFVMTEYAARRAVLVDDVRRDPIRVPPDTVAAYEAIGIRAHITVPVVHSDRVVSCISVHSSVPRHWKPEEVEILRAVVERTWLTVEVLRQHRALVRGVEEQRARAEREALLNRVGQELRASPEPEQVLTTAVRELAEALGADRCYFVAYDQDADTAIVGPEWHRAGMPPLTGRYQMSLYSVNRDFVYKAGRTQVLFDTQEDAAAQRLGLCALVRVPLVSGTSMTALSVAMASGPRFWTPEEVLLVEAVATQTQTALEVVRVQRRAHRIAEQLQAALQPEIPQGIGGLKLAKYYEAALEEAGVGGDFYDVFAIEEGHTALVVGDLSGKGLAAAAQVSIVRNMLRAFLYSKPTVADAVNELNRVLAGHNLLTGFATLFVGCYDGNTRTLKYVNCGQEAGLLRRDATGTVEMLSPTGPILGTIEGAEYEEVSVMLAPKDCLAIFSDGLTEVGPARTEMLGAEGVAALLRQPIDDGLQETAGIAEFFALRLIAGVDEAAQGGVMRDDVCLLVAAAD